MPTYSEVRSRRRVRTHIFEIMIHTVDFFIFNFVLQARGPAPLNPNCIFFWSFFSPVFPPVSASLSALFRPLLCCLHQPRHEQIGPFQRAHSPNPCFFLVSVTRRPAPQMAKDAIMALKERNGSSLQAIKKHIQATNPTLNFLPHRLRSALKKGTEAGTFVKVWNQRPFSLAT